MNSENEILTIEEVAKYLRVSERTVYEWAQKGEIPAGKIGTSWRFKRSEIEKWVDAKLGGNNSDKTTLNSKKILDALLPSRCFITEFTKKKDIITFLSNSIAEFLELDSKENKKLIDAILEREELMSTGIGLGIGIPHVRVDFVKETVIAFAVNKYEISDYESLDGKGVRLVALIVAGANKHTEYLILLSSLSKKLKNEIIRERLLECKSQEEIYKLLIE